MRSKLIPVLAAVSTLLLLAVTADILVRVSAFGRAREYQASVKTSVSVDYGEPLPAASAFVDGAKIAAMRIVNAGDIDTSTPGLYPVRLDINGAVYESVLKVEDNEPPSGSARPVVTVSGEILPPSAFVTDVSDTSPFAFAFTGDETPDFYTPGTRPVSVEVTDLYGNAATFRTTLKVLSGSLVAEVYLSRATDFEINAETFAPEGGGDIEITESFEFAGEPGDYYVTLSLAGRPVRAAVRVLPDPDVTPPVISGAHDIAAALGDRVLYRNGVTVTDDFDPNVELTIDSSAVDTGTPGRYPAVYSATDRSGNTAETRVYVTVSTVAAETVNALAAEVLAKITEPDDYDRAKVRAIRDWVHDHVAYVSKGDKTDIYTGAYNGFTLKKGDCYTFFATEKILLDLAGIENLECQRMAFQGFGTHYWNLVKLDGKWYHSDSTPSFQTFRTDVFGEKLASSYKPNWHYYEYDKSLYPEVEP